jgi:hypothetical protein
MKALLIASVAAVTLMVTMVVGSSNADAVVCAAGVYRAGCVGPHGAAVVGRPAVVPHGAVCRRYGVVGGVRRCVLY